MKKILFSLLYIMLPFALHAEDISAVIQKIMENNVTLRKYRAQTDAAKAGNNVGLTLADPEVEFNYLWGSPNDVGQRKDISVTQHFDYATLFGLKRREAHSRDELAEIEYEQARILLQQEALLTIADIATANETIAEHESRLAIAEKNASLLKRKMDAGDANKIEYNKALLDLASHKADLSEAVMERDALLCNVIFHQSMNDEMKVRLCSVSLDDIKEYVSTPGTSTLWQIEEEKAQREERVADAELRTVRSASLPELTAGYMSELTREEKFRGITVGLSVPLWSNRGNVAKVRQQKVALLAERDETIANMQSRRSAILSRVDHLSRLIESIQLSLKASSSDSLLRKALAEGEISITEYLSDRESYYDLRSRLIATKGEHAKCLIELGVLGNN